MQKLEMPPPPQLFKQAIQEPKLDIPPAVPPSMPSPPLPQAAPAPMTAPAQAPSQNPSKALPLIDLDTFPKEPPRLKQDVHSEPMFDAPTAPATYEEQHIKFHEPVPHIPDAPKMQQARPVSVPHLLPEFPVKPKAQPAHIFAQPETRKADDVPMPPPNLRSEISPLELERLEEKYLNERFGPYEQHEEYDRHKDLKKPLFVRTDSYRELLDAFIDVKDRIKLAEEIIYRLENLKKNADIEFSEYKKGVEDIQRKLIYVDKSIFE